jgi:hypothetical protein
MSYIPRFLASSVALTLALTTSVCGAPSFAEQTPLISLGPRVGFTGKIPLLGEQQKTHFGLYDVAAVFRLPWLWELSGSWKVETRLITSAGVLVGGGDTGLIATLVPDIALSGWSGLVSLDIGGGAGLLPEYKFGMHNFGGPVQLVATIGIRFNVLYHAYAGFRLHHISDAGIYGESARGNDLYVAELGYRF